MKRVRVEEFGESKNEDCGWVNLVFSLGFLSQNSLWKLSTFCGYKGIYSRVCMECEKSVTTKQDVLVTRANCLAKLEVLSCSAIAGVTLQLPLHASHVCHFGDLPVANRKIQSWDSFELHTSWVFFTLFHTLPLHDSHLNTRFLNTELKQIGTE